MSADRPTSRPPHELTGMTGQLAGVPITPTPGLTTGAARVPHAPTLPSDDPAMMAVMIGQLANELFLGTSIAPVPLSPSSIAGALAQTTPTPGYQPSLAPLAIDETRLFQPTEPVVPPVPGAPSGTLGAAPSPSAFGPGLSMPTSFDGLEPSFGSAPPIALLAESPASSPFDLPLDLSAIDTSLAYDHADLDLALVPPSIAGAPGAPTMAAGPSSVPTAPPANPAGGTILPLMGVPTHGLPTAPGDTLSIAALPGPDTATPPRPTTPASPPIPDVPDSTASPFAPSAIEVPAFPTHAVTGLPGSSAVAPGSPASAPRADGSSVKPFDPHVVRADFPILQERVATGKRLVWLDNGATTQKPRAVIDRLSYFYEHENSNIHRAAHTLAARATDAYENARETVRRFLNAPSAGEIVFVRGTTEGLNLIAKTYGKQHLGEGDEIVITHLEHHANIVPWQQLCAETGARLKVAPVDDRGQIILEEYTKLFTERTKLASITQVSNALGTITPARAMIDIAHRAGACVVLDGAQAVSHMRVDVQALDCDFYVFSGHKVFGPTGIGAVFGKRAILDAMPPWQGGGNMIADVTFERTVYQPPPFRFEAGTGNIADAVGLGAALDYVMRIGMDVIDRYEHELLLYATERLLTVRGLRLIGTADAKAGVLSFVLDGKRTEDIGAALDKEGIAVRSGHHCAQPILRRFGLEASVRASLAFYNVTEDIDALIAALHRIAAG